MTAAKRNEATPVFRGRFLSIGFSVTILGRDLSVLASSSYTFCLVQRFMALLICAFIDVQDVLAEGCGIPAPPFSANSLI